MKIFLALLALMTITSCSQRENHQISITLNNGKVITCTHTKSIGHTLICNNGFYQDEIPIETIKIVNDTEYGDYKPFISKTHLEIRKTGINHSIIEVED